MLSHLKVIELASVLAGPDVGMFFAELGAEVIKIENKLTKGDITRQWKLNSENKLANVSAYYSAVNWHKKVLLINLKDEKDRNKVYQLVKEVDIVIANFKYGDDLKLKMDYDTLKKHNPTIIYGAINGFGKNNNRIAYDVVLQAETGFMSMNGTQKSGPIKMPVALIDVLAAHQLKEGLLLALLNKEKTKKGAFVEVSLYDTAVASLKNQATNWLMNQHIAKPIGSLHPNIAPYGEIFLTKDNKLIVLAIGSDKQFVQLLKVIGAEQLIHNSKFLTNQKRVSNRKDLATRLAPFIKKETRKKLIQLLIQENIPTGAINNIKEVFENENAQQLILEENIEGIPTKRVKTAIFKIS